MEKDPTLGMEGSAYFRKFLDNNKHRRRGSLVVQKPGNSPRHSQRRHVKLAEATLGFDKRRTWFKPKYTVSAALYDDGFVEVFRVHKDGSRDNELFVDRISLLLTVILEPPSKKKSTKTVIFKLKDAAGSGGGGGGGDVAYTLTHSSTDINALEFVRLAKKISKDVKRKHQDQLVRLTRGSTRSLDAGTWMEMFGRTFMFELFPVKGMLL